MFPALAGRFFFFFFFNIYLAVSGLSCGMQDLCPLLWPVGSLAEACKLLIVARGI